MSDPGSSTPESAPSGARGDEPGKRKRRRRRRPKRGADNGSDAPAGRAASSGSAGGGETPASDGERGAAGERKRRSRRSEGRRRQRRSGEAGARPERRRRRSGKAPEADGDLAENAAAPPPDGDGPTRRRRRRRGGEEHSDAPRSPDVQRADAADGAASSNEGSGERRRRRRRRGGQRSDDAAMRVSDRSTAVADDRPGRSHLAPAVSEDDQAARAEALEEEVHELAYFAPPRPEPSADPEGEDPDPVSFELESLETDENRSLETRVKHVVGVKFSATGRIVLHDSGDEDYRAGEPVVVAVERGTRRGVVAIASHRRVHNGKKLARVLRRPNDKDQRAARAAADQTSELLQSARAHARTLGMPVKVFRAEASRSGKKVVVYFTAEGRVDGRALMKRLSQQFNLRVELRQTGVRDGAKAVGGIGSCGLELCCTTWLPEFVPVSIKMAKDQGLVLNPTKVSGQCGRLKCCLVYEQETYAALRKGLPKLGKRVITAAGEGRVVEVDVLRQRVRVSLGPGESEVFPGHEVKPMFPSQPQKPRT